MRLDEVHPTAHSPKVNIVVPGVDDQAERVNQVSESGFKHQTYLRYLMGAALLWLLFTLINGLWLANAKSPLIYFDPTPAGSIGDSFGPISAMMAAIAAYGAWVAVSLQRRELEDSKTALTEERLSSADARFEQTFFLLFQQLPIITGELAKGNPSGGFDNKPVFDQIAFHQRTYFFTAELHTTDPEVSYREFFAKYGSTISPFFRFIYHIINLVLLSNSKRKEFYLKLLFSQLSNAQMLLLAANYAFHDKGKNVLPTAVGFRLLHNIDFNDNHSLIDPLRKIYGETYFQ